MAAEIWLRMLADLKTTYGIRSIPFGLMQRLGKIPKKNVPEFLDGQAKL
jgi:hypothetical protein